MEGTSIASVDARSGSVVDRQFRDGVHAWMQDCPPTACAVQAAQAASIRGKMILTRWQHERFCSLPIPGPGTH